MISLLGSREGKRVRQYIQARAFVCFNPDQPRDERGRFGEGNSKIAEIPNGMSSRLRYEVIQQPTRSLISSYKRDEEKNWLDKADPYGNDAVVETSISHPLDRSQGIYLDRIDSMGSSKGKGYATETLKYAFSHLVKQGYTFGKAYVERGNSASEGLLKKFKGEVIEKRQDGNVFKFYLGS